MRNEMRFLRQEKAKIRTSICKSMGFVGQNAAYWDAKQCLLQGKMLHIARQNPWYCKRKKREGIGQSV